VTSTAFYRLFFRLWKDGLGPDSWLHERNLFEPNNDLTLGCVDLQRTSFDTDKITPDLVSRSGLRWYKNRVVLNYDMDSKDLTGAWKSDDFHGAERDGRRMTLTMAYVASSRLLLPNSFRDLSAEALHDLSRVVPFSREPRSARPIDAFTADGWPRVYDYAITPQWHQVVLYNEALPTKQTDVELPLSGRPVDGALGLKPGREYYVYDFWNEHCVGRIRGSESLRQTLRPGEARMLAVHEVEPNPQFLSTNRHLMQGYEDFARIPVWDASTATLGGASKVVGGETYRVTIALNGREVAGASTAADGARVAVVKHGSRPDLAILEIDSPVTATVEWKVNFKK
jgi:hypothetical protein